ncbi:MAG: hypothetical protein HQM08_27810 [Candidatus Riflebacteria bacterium]|nr:hypothetical protein [Candidatus Riflebacteria bacterium]
MSTLVFRNPCEDDILPIMRLYQLATSDIWRDRILLDYKALESAFEKEARNWLVGEKDGKVVGFASFLLESEQRLGKISRIYMDSAFVEDVELTRELFANLISRNSDLMDIMYISTRYISFQQLEIALNQGFRIIGFFPISPSQEKREVSALAAYFYPGVLENLRTQNVKTHPLIGSFFEAVFPELKIEVEPFKPSPNLEMPDNPIPELEILEASGLVVRKFQKLRELKLLTNNFYPFQQPNSMIVDANERIRIFLSIQREFRFAAIIEENLEEWFNPCELYNKIARMLNSRGINYIEMIVDSGDISALNFMLSSGFLPMVPFPALKKHGSKRRDFVILGHSFERLDFSSEKIREKYPRFHDFYSLQCANIE